MSGGFSLGAATESTLDEPAPAVTPAEPATDVTPVARPVLSGDPAAWMSNQRKITEAAPKPAARAYSHGTECNQRGVDPVWELVSTNPEVPLWRRACQGRRCGAVQYSEAAPLPRPPRPTRAELDAWAHMSATTGEDGRTETVMACPSIPPVVDVRFEADGQDRRRGHWVGRCRLCRSTKHFSSAAHYAGLGEPYPVRVSDLGGAR